MHARHIISGCAFLLLFAARPLAAQYSAFNQFLSLSGSGYVSVSYNRAFNGALNGFISIDAWVRPASLTSYMTVVGNDYTVGYWLGITPSGKIRFYPTGGVYYDSPGSIAANQWTHIAVSYNSFKTTLRFYINGAVNGTVSTQVPVGSVSNTDLRIGADRQSGSPAYYWNGDLDEVRIWKDEINFSTALGLLYRIPQGVFNGRYGKALVAGWRLNGDADGIAGAYNGSTVGTTSFGTVPDPPHYARIGAVFNNISTVALIPDYFNVKSSSYNSLVANYTIECWVKPFSTGGAAAYQTFVSKGSLSANVWSYWLGLNKANGKVRFVPNGDFANGVESNAAIPINSWTHVAARYTVVGGTRTAVIFINGQPAGNRNYASNASPNSYEMLIGRADNSAAPGDGYGFSGVLDEIRLWSTARSDAEIDDNHLLELDGPISGLSASYHCDGEAFDASGNGQDGTAVLATNSDLYFIDDSDLPAFPIVRVVVPNGGEDWTIGTTHAIQWTLSGLSNVRLELSRDGGATFPEILASSVPAAPAVFNWTVTGPETAKAVVRATTPTPTSVADVSDGVFSISVPKPQLAVTPSSLVFTASHNAALPASATLLLDNVGGGSMTWSADPVHGVWMDFAPSSGAANHDSIVVSVNTTALAEGSYTDSIKIGGNAINAPEYVPVTYRITSQRIFSIRGRVLEGSNGLRSVPVLVTGAATATLYTDSSGAYDAEGLPEGDYQVIPSSPFFDFLPASRSYTPLSSNVTDANFAAQRKNGRVLVRYKEGWNLCSLPVIPTNSDMTLIFPDATPPAYSYDGASGYTATNDLVFGRGYWIRFTRTDSAYVSGELQGTMTATLDPSYGGWNLIGAPSGDVSIPSIIQTPPGSILSVFEYDPDLGYFTPFGGVLHPGRGYFVKTAAAASIYLGAGALAPGTVFGEK